MSLIRSLTIGQRVRARVRSEMRPGVVHLLRLYQPSSRDRSGDYFAQLTVRFEDGYYGVYDEREDLTGWLEVVA